MPHPHEQKLQEVVNSLTFDSLNVCAAAFTAATSSTPSSARPRLPPAAAFNQSRRLTVTFRSPLESIGILRLTAVVWKWGASVVQLRCHALDNQASRGHQPR